MTQKKNEPESEDSLVANRYGRQELIEGWKQDQIRNATIAVVGSSVLAQFTAASLVSLGFGRVEIYDNARPDKSSEGEFLLSLTEKRDFNVEALEDILSKINPLVRVKGITTKVNSASLAQLLGTPTVIIDTSQDHQSQATVLEYAEASKIPLVVAVADSAHGELYSVLPRKKKMKFFLEDYYSKPQGALPSEVLGGIITEEVRKIVMPFSKKDAPVQSLRYSLASPQRFSGSNAVEISEAPLDDKRVLLVGAGALGNFAGIGLAVAGVGEIDILDFDTVETTNLNRQLLFYDSVGQNKSKALAQKLAAINPTVKVKGLVGKLDERYTDYFTSKDKPDLILDCVDNLATRAIVNYFAVKYKIPVVSGGTNPSSGQVVVYKPGESSCLDCKLGVDKALGKERNSHSCVYAAQPSVIMTNQIIGGLMAAEMRAVLASQQYGNPIRKMLRYDSENPNRAGLAGGEKPCSCERGPIQQWIKEIVKKGKYASGQ